MSLALSLHDAANNCRRDGATAVLTLRSGVQLAGKLDPPTSVDTADKTVHIKTESGGWITARIEEVAAVESRR